MTKFLLRLGVQAPAAAWAKSYRRWLETLRLPQPLQQVVLEEERLAVAQAEQRVERLAEEIGKAAQDGPQAAVIGALQALRGVALVTAATLVAAIGDVTRFRSPRELMAYAGVVPSEHSSGGSQRRGRITKTGNAHVRCVVVEAAWHYRHGPRLSKALKARQQGQPAEVPAIADKAQRRLNRRLGFIWAIAWAVCPEDNVRPTHRQAAYAAGIKPQRLSATKEGDRGVHAATIRRILAPALVLVAAARMHARRAR